MQNLNVSYIQTAQFWEDKVKNLAHFDLILKQHTIDCDLLLLPEMFNTSFSMNTSLAEEMTGPSIEWLKKISIQNNTAVAATLMIKENNKIYNRLVFVDGNSISAYYDKMHLFTHAGEDDFFTCGNKKVIIDFKGWKILLQTCYDLRFPESSRNTHDDPYDLVIYLANWPSKRSYAWESLLQSRAIENQCYLVGVNRIGADGNNHKYEGQSAVYDPWGLPKHSSDTKEEFLTVELYKNELSKIRLSFNTLKDKH